MMPTVFVSQLLLFVMGAAVSQWGRKPTLSFLLAPFWASLWCSPVLGLLRSFPEMTWTLWLAVVVWLFATWRLTPRLMEGQTGPGLWVRGLAYAMLAMGVISTGIFGSIWWTTPPAIPAWRAQTLISETPKLPAGLWDKTEITIEEVESISLRRRSNGPPETYDFHPNLQNLAPNEFQSLKSGHLARMPKELRISVDRPRPVSGQSEHWFQVASTHHALHKATVARLNAANTGSLAVLLQVAEPSEREGLFWLQQMAQEQGLFESKIEPPSSQSQIDQRARFVRLVGQIPSKELRRQSRMISLLSEWKRFQSSPTRFAGRQFSDPRYRLEIERRRIRRLIDHGTRTVLHQLETTLPSRMDYPTWELIRQWQLAIDTPAERIRSHEFPVGIPVDVPIFLVEHEELIDRLQKAAESL